MYSGLRMHDFIGVFEMLFRLYGDYESLSTGYTADALVDFTGGVAEHLALSSLNVDGMEGRDQLFMHLLESRENKMLMVCNVDVGCYS